MRETFKYDALTGADLGVTAGAEVTKTVAFFPALFSALSLVTEAVGFHSNPHTLKTAGVFMASSGIYWGAGKLRKIFNKKAESLEFPVEKYEKSFLRSLAKEAASDGVGVGGAVVGFAGSVALALSISIAASKAIDLLPEEIPENPSVIMEETAIPELPDEIVVE